MKTLYKALIVLSCVLLTFNKAFAQQTWAAPGATWHYTIAGDGWTSTGYVKITKTGDTLIQSKPCDILEKRAVYYSYWQMQFFNNVYGYEYTYTQNNVVYHLRNNLFYVLYDFNATPGTGWIVAAPQMGIGSQCGDSGSVSVTQTGTMTVGGQNRQYLSVIPDVASMYGFNPSASNIIEGIGNVTSFIPDFVGCIVDANEMWGLRCYTDSSGFFYTTPGAPVCDFVVGINDISFSQIPLTITPNPASTTVTITLNNTTTQQHNSLTTLTLYDLTGRALLQQPFTSSPHHLNIASLKSGMYMVEIKDVEGRSVKGKLIKN